MSCVILANTDNYSTNLKKQRAKQIDSIVQKIAFVFSKKISSLPCLAKDGREGGF
jgi:hypothetical protein